MVNLPWKSGCKGDYHRGSDEQKQRQGQGLQSEYNRDLPEKRLKKTEEKEETAQSSTGEKGMHTWRKETKTMPMELPWRRLCLQVARLRLLQGWKTRSQRTRGMHFRKKMLEKHGAGLLQEEE